MDTYLGFMILILILLILLSGFFSASETALTSFRNTNLDKLENENHKKEASLLKKWLKDPNEFLIAILLGNNIVNILSSSIATVITINIVGNSSGKAIAISTAVMTVIVLVFGEITPKIIAKNSAVTLSRRVIKLVYAFAYITKPLVAVFMFISKLLGRMFGVEIRKNILMTEEDIISMVNVGKEEGIIEEDEQEMIHSIVGFGETTAKEVMTPRTAMLAFECNKTINEIWDEMIENGFSRIPIYEGTIDNIIGVLYVKDIMNAIKEGKNDTPIRDFVRTAYFIPETKSIIEILNEFRKLQVHIAMVIDEYGGIVGIVTIEDLIEEIVGDIRDEYDTEEEEYIKQIDEKTYEVDAMIDIETLDDELNIQLPESEDYESLGGLIVTILGKVASVGDEIIKSGVKIKVLELDKMRVSKVRIEKLSSEEEQALKELGEKSKEKE
ncbi:hemolysin family protein [Fusobacterium sp. PH5-44]|uniref:hemolysin family protein n=1 Tax=unclassified Fusobacterium TaxID=2648384 RepID=UPI003D1FB87F